MKKILFLTSIIIFILSVSYFSGAYKNLLKSPTAYAVGDLTVNWGVPAGQPIFQISNMVPGNTFSRTVQVNNGASQGRPVAVRGIPVSDSASMAGVMDISISQNGTDIYGGTKGVKTLSQFFSESAGPEGVPLSVLNPNSSSSYIFSVTFNKNAGNEFQGKSVVFDLRIGVGFTIPEQCKSMTFKGDPIFGTQGDDRINAGAGNQLIIVFEGNDTVNGGSGNDCIVGTTGNKSINGGSGDDTLIAQTGTNSLMGDSGNDILIGGTNSLANGGSGKDTCTAGKKTFCEI